MEAVAVVVVAGAVAEAVAVGLCMFVVPGAAFAVVPPSELTPPL